jgi:hypothetical protein
MFKIILFLYNIFNVVISKNIVNNIDTINYINNVQKKWVSHESPRFNNLELEHVKQLCGVDIHNSKNFSISPIIINYSYYLRKDEEIPKNFDARDQWKDCSTISTIRNQGSCGSCWAFATTESFNDRLCIATNGKFQQLLSPQDTLNCCDEKYNSYGCNGGQPSGAWKFFEDKGIVTGGDYGDISTCLPYSLYSEIKVNNDNGDFKNCLSDIILIIKDVESIIENYKEKNVLNVMNDVINLSKDILNIYKFCLSKNTNDCLIDFVNILDDLELVLEQVKQNELTNVEEILKELNNIYINISKISKDCFYDDKKLTSLTSNKCIQECINKDYPIKYLEDKHKTISSYSISTVKNIQLDLMKYGPLSVAMIVYEDFPTYKSGIYHHVTGNQLGGHAIKLIGWGVNNDNEEYWILNNSWGENWGENGTFKIRKGVDECNIETLSVDAGRIL